MNNRVVRICLIVVVAILLILHGALWLAETRQKQAEKMRVLGQTWGAVDSGGHPVQD